MLSSAVLVPPQECADLPPGQAAVAAANPAAGGMYPVFPGSLALTTRINHCQNAMISIG
jgi:hypothetical protein